MAELGENSGREAEEHDGTNSRHVPEPVCGGTGDPAVTVPLGLWSPNHDLRKKLVLHVDLNNTILVSDAVMALGPVAALEYYISTVTWGKMSKQGKLDPVVLLGSLCLLSQQSYCSCGAELTRGIIFNDIAKKSPASPLYFLNM